MGSQSAKSWAADPRPMSHRGRCRSRWGARFRCSLGLLSRDWSCYDLRLMTRPGRDLLSEALELPLDDRAKTAAELLESLQEAEAEVEEAWASEIRKRVAAARAGELAGTDWRTVLDRVEREVLGR